MYNITMPPKKRSINRPNGRANSFISRSRLGKKNTISIQEADAIPILESRISLGERSKARRIPIAEEITPSSHTATRGRRVHIAEVVDASPKGYFRKLWKRVTQRNRKIVPVNEGPELMPKRLGGKRTRRRVHKKRLGSGYSIKKKESPRIRKGGERNITERFSDYITELLKLRRMDNREIGDFFADEVMKNYIYEFIQILTKEDDLICLKLLIIRIEDYIKSESKKPDNHLFGLKLFRLFIQLLGERALEIIRKSGNVKLKDDLEKQKKTDECYDETDLNDKKLLYFIKLFEKYREKNNDEITLEFVDAIYDDLNKTMSSISEIADNVIIDNYILMLKEKLTNELSSNGYISISSIMEIITNFIKERPKLFEIAKAKQNKLLEQLESEKQETQEKNEEIKKNGYDLDDYKNAIDEYINMDPSKFLKEVDEVMQKLKQYTITHFREEIKYVYDGYYLNKIKNWLTGVNGESPAKTDLFRLPLPYIDLIEIIDKQLSLPNITTNKNESIDYHSKFSQSKIYAILNTFRRHAKTPYFIITTVIKNKINQIENFEEIAGVNIDDDNKVKNYIIYLTEKLSQPSENNYIDDVIREMIVVIMRSLNKQNGRSKLISNLPPKARALVPSSGVMNKISNIFSNLWNSSSSDKTPHETPSNTDKSSVSKMAFLSSAAKENPLIPVR